MTLVGGSDCDHSQEKEMKKAKWLSEEALQIAEKRKDTKGKGGKETYTHYKCRIPGFPVLHQLLEFAQTHVH